MVKHGKYSGKFACTESVIMAFKHSIDKNTPTLVELLEMYRNKSARDAKLRAKKEGYPLWADHWFQVLLGATACLLKFSQNDHLRRALFDTGEAILMEARRGDGSWGIAKSALEFINSEEDPMHYALGSVDPSLISFPVGEQTFKRPRCCANALGKAQPHDNAMLIRY